MLFLSINPLLGYGQYDYQKKVFNHHVVHVITLSPQEYQLSLVKSHDQIFGLETLSHMAERSSVDVAINAGFFEMHGKKKGMPTGSLIINGSIYSLRHQQHDVLMSFLDKVMIRKVTGRVDAKIGHKRWPIKLVNDYPKGSAIVLYSDRWGETTHTVEGDRKEVQLDNQGQVIKVYDHGNVSIPSHGYVLSFPQSYQGNLSSVVLDFKGDLFERNVSAVMGIPMLVTQGRVVQDLYSKKSDFYVLPHARTAFGIKPNGDWVVVVAENTYQADLDNYSSSELMGLVRKFSQDGKFQEVLHMDINQLKDWIKSNMKDFGNTQGLTIVQLANLMVDMGCVDAINLDGGGSSTLWVSGKVINQTIGDEDWGLGLWTQRPIATAIVFKSRHGRLSD